MTPNGNSIGSVAADVSQVEGTGPLGTTIVPLTLSSIPNVYTNSVVVGAAIPTNTAQSFNIMAVDSAKNTNQLAYSLNIVIGYPAITAVANPNPVGRGPAITTIITATVTPLSYPISTVTVSGSPIVGSPVTLVSSNGTSIYTNSVTVNPLAVTGPLTVTVVDSGAESRRGPPSPWPSTRLTLGWEILTTSGTMPTRPITSGAAAARRFPL